jgi:two-component system NarL family sensor kinase
MDAREHTIFIAVLIAVMVTGGIIAYFIYSLLRYHRRMLHLQNEYALAQVTALEKDRERTATDIHDDLAPMLVAVRLRVNSFELREEGDQHALERTNEIIDEMARRMREVSFDLMPGSLKLKGLFSAVQSFINQVNEKNGLQIRCTLPAVLPHLSDHQSIHIYRIVQEVIHNTIKHAGATELDIRFKKEKNHLLLVSKDNGRGFHFEQHLHAGSGLGLRSILNRINLLDGSYRVDSRPGAGTLFEFKIPLEYEPAL